MKKLLDENEMARLYYIERDTVEGYFLVQEEEGREVVYTLKDGAWGADHPNTLEEAYDFDWIEVENLAYAIAHPNEAI